MGVRDTSGLLAAATVPAAVCLERRLWLPVGKESGHLHSRLRRSQWLQRGLSSSHLTFRRLHVRQPYLERAEDLFERAGPPAEFGVPRSFSGLGDMIAAASL